MSFKPEVFVDNQWSSNAVVFATKEEAETSARDLFGRWMLCKDWRAVESTDKVNYAIIDNQMVAC